MDIYASAHKVLDQIKAETDRVLVAFSGGKESWCVLDMAVKNFATVIPIHYEFVSGLEVVEGQIRKAEERYGVTVERRPHSSYLASIIYANYRNSDPRVDELNPPRWGHMIELSKREHNCPHILTGARRSDSNQRRILMDRGHYPGTHPLSDWSKAHVLAYLKRQGIPLPPSHKGHTTGIGLDHRALLWLHDQHRDDFERIRVEFPYVPASPARRKFYGYTG